MPQNEIDYNILQYDLLSSMYNGLVNPSPLKNILDTSLEYIMPKYVVFNHLYKMLIEIYGMSEPHFSMWKIIP